MSPHVGKIAILIAFCGGFILFGLISAASSVSDWRNRRHSLTWPGVVGVITKSVRRRANKNLKRLEYKYNVNGKAYAASRAAFMRVPYSTPLHKVYRTGQTVYVRYDPADPARAVLEPGTPFLAILAEALIPILLIGFGVVGLFYGFKR